MTPTQETQRRKAAKDALDRLLTGQPVLRGLLFTGDKEKWHSRFVSRLVDMRLAERIGNPMSVHCSYRCSDTNVLQEYRYSDVKLNGLIWPSTAVEAVPSSTPPSAPPSAQKPATIHIDTLAAAHPRLSSEELNELCLKAIAANIETTVKLTQQVSALRKEIEDIKNSMAGVASDAANAYQIIQKLL